jgi:hypothetical protein
VYKEYGIALDTRGDYQIDHRISLSFGGSNHMDNLWPLPYDDARRKAQLEEQLYLQINSGQIVQAEAIAQILAWR